MSDKKISELTELLGASVADDDFFPLVDTSATETKKITYAEFVQALLVQIYGSTHYSADRTWKQNGSASAEARRTVVTPSELKVAINGKIYIISSQQTFDLNTAANWNSTDTGYAVASARAGKDFYIYACVPGSGTTPEIVLTDDSTYPDDYTADTSRKIGGFHCLCTAVGTIAGHDLTGYLQGDILPLSVWDLNHRAASENEGMVWDERINKWVDIYLASGTGSSTASVNGGTISDTRNWMDFVDDMATVNKRLLDDDEFSVIAAGSNEETNIAGSADPVTTGGHSDTASRRMISDIGCEDCCGALYQWLRTQSSMYDDAVSAGWYDLDGAKGSYYRPVDSNDVKLLAGSGWGDAADCGSRCRGAANYRWAADASIGARGCAEPRVVNL